MNFRTIISIPESKIKISHQSKILMLGSCFTTNIGQKLIDNKFNIDLNPFGILYNPSSIAKGITYIIENKKFCEEDLFYDKGVYNSFYHHSSFSNKDKEQCLHNINARIEESHRHLQQADILFITFGTSYVYEYIATKEIVGNCHKRPSKDFNRFRLTISEIAEQWGELLSLVKGKYPKLQIIFTVSPIRHLRDGAHDNQLSKSTLLLAINEICATLSDVHYFPSYEIVLDDLRDYRFYADDLVHPNNLAIEYIWEKITDVYMSEETKKIMAEWERLRKGITHRPFNENSEEHITFLKQILAKLNAFANKHQDIDLTKERMELEKRIANN